MGANSIRVIGVERFNYHVNISVEDACIGEFAFKFHHLCWAFFFIEDISILSGQIRVCLIIISFGSKTLLYCKLYDWKDIMLFWIENIIIFYKIENTARRTCQNVTNVLKLL